MKTVRHGDLIIVKCDSIPKEAKKQKGTVLLDGEVTGHAHRLETKTVDVFEQDGVKFFALKEMTALVHEEHKTIELQPGIYKTSRMREFDPYSETIRNVQD